MALFETSITLPGTCEKLFEFLIRPANILKISPPEAALEFFDAPEILQLGSRFEFQVTAIGPPQRMTHEITHFEPSSGFTETQLSGPLAQYHYEHILEADGDTSVRVVDRIEFEPPGGLAGFLITEAWIRKSLDSGFEHRHLELRRLFESV